MATRKSKKHEFEKLPEFDRALRKLVTSPKEPADSKAKTPKRKKNRFPKHKPGGPSAAASSSPFVLL